MTETQTTCRCPHCGRIITSPPGECWPCGWCEADQVQGEWLNYWRHDVQGTRLPTSASLHLHRVLDNPAFYGNEGYLYQVRANGKVILDVHVHQRRYRQLDYGQFVKLEEGFTSHYVGRVKTTPKRAACRLAWKNPAIGHGLYARNIGLAEALAYIRALGLDTQDVEQAALELGWPVGYIE
jgi:hypothetical protein